MFTRPSGIALGDYSSEVIQSIHNFGGKLGVLHFLGNNPQIRNELKACGVYIGPNLAPLIIGNPSTGISELEHTKFITSFNLYTKAQDGLEQLSTGKALIRSSVPGDWRSLVDIIPSFSVKPSLDAINQGIQRVTQEIQNSSGYIKHYALSTGVPFDPDDVKIGVVTAFNLPTLTVTENPNNGDFYLDEFQGKLGGITGGSKIYTTTTDVEGNTKSNFGGSHSSEKDKVIRVKKMIEILRKYRILDPTMAYQFEFGRTYNSDLILYQIKELSKKIPVSPQLTYLYPMQVSKVLLGGASGYTLPVIPALTPAEWMETRDIKNDTSDGFAFLGNNSSNLNLPSQIDVNMRGVFSGDSHSGSLVHNSFRYVQQVLQSGGVALLGEKIGGMFQGYGEVTQILEDLKEKSIRVVQAEEGVINIDLVGGNVSDDAEEVQRRIEELSRRKLLIPRGKD